MTESPRPEWGLIGPPEGIKPGSRRVDFKRGQLEQMIETKGYRLAWWRAAVCPCTSANDQTQQPDPNCEFCHAQGWIYFGLTGPLSEHIGGLDDVQDAIIGDPRGEHAAVVRGLETGIGERPDMLNRMGRWISGDTMVTVRHENVLGYYDRLVNLDAEMIFAEIRTASGGTGCPTRYPAVAVNLLRSKTTIFEQSVDYHVRAGVITWETGKQPTVGTRLSLHYMHHPTWLVVDHPHIIRAATQMLKMKEPPTPVGAFQALPLQAHVRLEFLI